MSYDDNEAMVDDEPLEPLEDDEEFKFDEELEDDPDKDH